MGMFVHFVGLVLVVSALVAMDTRVVWALPVGSFTFTYEGRAPDDTTIRIGLEGLSGPSGRPLPTIDFIMDISANDRNEATQRLITQLKDRLKNLPLSNVGFEIKEVSPNSIDVIDKPGGAILTAVAGGSNKASFPVRLDGSDVEIVRNLKPGSKWRIGIEPTFAPEQATAGSFEGFAADSGVPQVAASASGLHLFSAFVPSGSTPAEAALLLYEAMLETGFPDVELQDTTVAFLLGPADGSSPPLPIIAIPDLVFTGANLLVVLTLPETLAERVDGPSTWLLVSGLAGLWLSRYGSRRQRGQALGKANRAAAESNGESRDRCVVPDL